MERIVEDFRHAERLLRDQRAWHSVDRVIQSISLEAIVAEQREFSKRGGRLPKGGQSALNRILDSQLRADDWDRQVRLFDDPELEKWTLDFRRDRIGVEVSFNHAEAIPWQFTRLNIAGESERVRQDARIDVGVVIVADKSLKAWSRMDAAVGTFDTFRAWLREMKPILPIPILLIGLRADGWAPTDVFPGTAIGTRGGLHEPPSRGPTAT